MMTVKQMDRLWESKSYDKLLAEVLAARVDAALFADLTGAVPTAAMVLVRLDELNQGYTPLASKLTRILLTSQEADGGWGDAMVTSVCLRALSAGGGKGLAVERGMNYLAMLQKDDGIWPRIPIKRTPGDATLSAFILLQLGGHPSFRAAVRFEDACRWFTDHTDTLDAPARRLWSYVAMRYAKPKVAVCEESVSSWS